MSDTKKPAHYERLRELYPAVIEQLEDLGKTLHDAGPLDEKAVLLIQLGAAAATFSEGSARSHARRALAAGATPDELRHALVCLTSTIVSIQQRRRRLARRGRVGASQIERPGRIGRLVSPAQGSVGP